MRLLNELRRRKVFRTAATYLAAAFVLLQVADLTFEPLGFSTGAYRALILLSAVGFPVAITLSWLFELRAEAPVAGKPRVPLLLTTTFILLAAGLLSLWAVRQWEKPTAAVAAQPSQLDERSYEEFVRAKYHMRKTSPATLDSAVVLLQRVVQRRPDFAAGHAQLALAYMYQYSTYRSNVAGLEEKALLASERALALNPRIPEAHVVRGRMLWTPMGGFAHEEAAAEYQHALKLDPGNAEARLQLGQVFAHVGLLDESIAAHREAARVSSVDPRPRTWAAQPLIYQGNIEEALHILRTAPANYDVTMIGYQIAWGLVRLQRYGEAEATLRRNFEKSTDDAGVLTSTKAMLLAKRGDAAGARRKIDEAAPRNQGSVHFHHTAYNIGVTHALLEQPDSAVAWLRRTADEGFPCYPLFLNDPDLRSLRSYPPFQDLLSELKRSQARYRETMLRKPAAVSH